MLARHTTRLALRILQRLLFVILLTTSVSVMMALLMLSKKAALSTTWELAMTRKVWNHNVMVGPVVYCNDLVVFFTISSFYIFAHTCVAVALNVNLIDWSGSMEVASNSETETEVDDSNDSDSYGEPPVTTPSSSTGTAEYLSFGTIQNIFLLPQRA